MVDISQEYSFGDLQKGLDITAIDSFSHYLQELHFDLSSRTNTNGITENTFCDYMKIPFIIAQKLFSTFNNSDSGQLTKKEFCDGFVTLYTGQYEEVCKLVFNIYDFKKEGNIKKADVKILLSYIPIADTLDHHKKYEHQMQTQEELDKLILDAFGSKKGNTSINYETFKDVISRKSDIFLLLICYLYERKPFDSMSINSYNKIKKSPNKTLDNTRSKKLKFELLNNDKIKRPGRLAQYLPVNKILTNSHSVDVSKNPKHPQHASIESPDKKDFNKTCKDKFIYPEFEEEIYMFESKLKKFYMTIFSKDIQIFKNSSKEELVHMINLDLCFIRENPSKKLETKFLYSFTILYKSQKEQDNSKTIYLMNQNSYKKWIEIIKKKTNQKTILTYYNMSKVLGKGGFGEVKLAKDISNDKDVAIKLINKKTSKKEDIDLLINEVDIMKKCVHPNIVKFHEFIEDTDYMYIVMEYLKGETLLYYLDHKIFIEEQEVKIIIHQLVDIVKYLHTYGIVHRDLKLDNIMIEDEDEGISIKLMDFGISRVIGNEEFLIENIGTLEYTAPEMFGNKYNKQIDIWSIGVIAYFLYSGEYPFTDPNRNDEIIKKKILYLDTEFTHERWKKASKELKEFCESCLQKDPLKRPTIAKLLKHQWLAK